MSSDPSKNDPKSNTVQNAQPAGAPEMDIPDHVSEDVYRFWKNHGSRIILYVVVILAAFLGTQVWKAVSSGRDDSIKNAYAQLETMEEKLAFANKHSSHGIAGYAYMEAAAEAVAEESFEQAIEYYDGAAKALKGEILEGMVLLNKAGVYELMGDDELAASEFDAIIDTVEFTKGIRAEAMFKRIALAMKNGQDGVVADLTAKLEAIEESNLFWTERLEGVKNYQ
jgi:tetratricopeptide (TPR) repeat protein